MPTFQSILRTHATAVATATFAVVAVTGVMVFFHLGERYVMGLHQWLGMAFVLAAAFHVARHWSGFKVMLGKTRTRVTLAAATAVTLVFVGAAALNPGGGNPMKQFVGTAADAPLSALAAVVGESPEALGARFRARGIDDVTVNDSLAAIARRHGRDMPALFRIVLSPSPVTDSDTAMTKTIPGG